MRAKRVLMFFTFNRPIKTFALPPRPPFKHWNRTRNANYRKYYFNWTVYGLVIFKRNESQSVRIAKDNIFNGFRWKRKKKNRLPVRRRGGLSEISGFRIYLYTRRYSAHTRHSHESKFYFGVFFFLTHNLNSFEHYSYTLLFNDVYHFPFGNCSNIYLSRQYNN